MFQKFNVFKLQNKIGNVLTFINQNCTNSVNYDLLKLLLTMLIAYFLLWNKYIWRSSWKLYALYLIIQKTRTLSNDVRNSNVFSNFAELCRESQVLCLCTSLLKKCKDIRIYLCAVYDLGTAADRSVQFLNLLSPRFSTHCSCQTLFADPRNRSPVHKFVRSEASFRKWLLTVA
jgi:hypothetical protein